MFLTGFMFFISALLARAENNCTAEKKVAVCSEASIQERVTWACDQLETSGKSALITINAMRFECCGEPNYVWINDFHPRMLIHPLKPALNGMDLSNEKDPSGLALFIEFSKAAKEKPLGSWVKYQWTKFGDPQPSQKKSWVRTCKIKNTDVSVVVGSGTWL